MVCLHSSWYALGASDLQQAVGLSGDLAACALQVAGDLADGDLVDRDLVDGDLVDGDLADGDPVAAGVYAFPLDAGHLVQLLLGAQGVLSELFEHRGSILHPVSS